MIEYVVLRLIQFEQPKSVGTMVHSHVLLLTVLSQFFFKPAEMKLGIRKKRILYGYEAMQVHRDAYPSFRYSVFLAKSAYLSSIEHPSWIRYELGLTSPVPFELVCGGVLLTPSIVQTACHCLAFYIIKYDDDNLTYGWPLDVWEDRIYSYFGNNKVRNMWDKLIPSHYITYERCSRLEGEDGPGYAIHDYGLILSKESLDKKAPEAKISYAPPYKAAEMQKFYYKAIQNEYMCLFIGYAPWATQLDDFGNPVVLDVPSEHVRWGWKNIMNYGDCLSTTYTPLERRKFYFNYTGEATWVCAYQNFNVVPWFFMEASGDSGGPVTCNEVYFSVISFTGSLELEDPISYSSPIIYTHFENSAEYRDQLIEWSAEYEAHEDEPLPHPEDEDFTVTPPYNSLPASDCPKLIVHFPLIIFVTCVLFTL